MNRSHLKRYIVDEMLHSEGHTVLRLPPYHSFFNAIEFVWSVAKQYYNKTVASRPGHGLDRATAVWKESLDQVTAEMWRNEVKHTEKKIVEFYNNEVRDLHEVEELVIHHGSSAKCIGCATQSSLGAAPFNLCLGNAARGAPRNISILFGSTNYNWKVTEVGKALGFDIKPEDIDSAHRLPSTKPDHNRSS
ncbi:uncharacterized protein [Anabrus simplex]|uniref:uncharacterized protein n=1 Tax=Anabrus simplex TaxID=316456 RepID=UPI0035A3609E